MLIVVSTSAMVPVMPTSFGRRLRELRKENDYTQRQLAEKAQIDFTYLRKIENDQPGYLPSEEIIRKLAKLLDADPEEFVLLAQRIPKNIQQSMARNPHAAEFLRDASNLSERDWKQILEILRKKRR